MEKKLDEYLHNITGLIRNRKKIGLIKEYRSITNCGLNEAKDIIEKHEDKNDPFGYFNEEGLLNEFRSVLLPETSPYTKEEFLNLITHAIDNKDVFYFKDMLASVHALLHNIENKGGLDVLAKERDKFLNGI